MFKFSKRLPQLNRPFVGERADQSPLMPTWMRPFAVWLLFSGSLSGLIVLGLLWGVFAPEGLGDPGELARWGFPIAKTITYVLYSLLVGILVFCCWACSSRCPEWQRIMRLAGVVACLLVPVLLITLSLSYLYTTAVPPWRPAFLGALVGYMSSGLGGGWALALIMVLITSLGVLYARRPSAVATVTVLAFASIVPITLQSHNAGTSGHGTAVMSATLHALGYSVWVGGLFAFAWAAAKVSRDRALFLLRRFSTLAVFALFFTALSGTISAVLRFNTPADLFTSTYGWGVILKVFFTGILAMSGVFNRMAISRRLRADSTAGRRGHSGGRHPGPDIRLVGWRRWLLIRVISGELFIMGILFGVAIVLNRTIPPVAAVPVAPGSGASAAELLTGASLPPPATFWRYLTETSLSPFWLAAGVVGGILYTVGFVRLRRRGDRWHWGKFISWQLGIAMLLYSTNGGVMLYGTYLFSAHMIMHMTLGMVVPVFLALGSPVTLILRACRKRLDGSRGLREWALALVGSRLGRWLSYPPLAAAIFILSMWIFYFSPLLQWAVSDPLGHMWMVSHFLVSGYLFTQSLLQTDPTTHRSGYPSRFMVLILAMGGHAFFGVALMSTSSLLLPGWFGAMGRTWGPTPLEDQALGGAIAWGITEVPLILMVVILAWRWFNSDHREAQRRDRAADRDGDPELELYNRKLAALAAKHSR